MTFWGSSLDDEAYKPNLNLHNIYKGLGIPMKKCLIFGYGQMGQCIAHAMRKLGFMVSVADMKFSNKVHNDVDVYIIDLDGSRGEPTINRDLHKLLLEVNPDIVISSLPYFLNPKVAEACIRDNYRYCDLGGSVPISKRINDAAMQNADESLKFYKPVMTDLGLAPGWINIMAAAGLDNVPGADTVHMMVGGIPSSPKNGGVLQYQPTWSMEGLINEYKDDCVVLFDGSIIEMPGMEGLVEITDFPELAGELEAFYTSGGIAHTIADLQIRGVQNCAYRTLRWKGHRDKIQWLINDCGLDNTSMAKVFNCKTVRENPSSDMVLMLCKVGKGSSQWVSKQVLFGGHGWTAMQRCTSFPIAAVASIMAEGELDDMIYLTYSDLPYKKFNEKLEILF